MSFALLSLRNLGEVKKKSNSFGSLCMYICRLHRCTVVASNLRDQYYWMVNGLGVICYLNFIKSIWVAEL